VLNINSDFLYIFQLTLNILAKAVDPNGHHKNTYVKSGRYSIACSEPSRIESLNITEEMEAVRLSNYDGLTDNVEFSIDSGRGRGVHY
jgi:hypothetical protein